MGSTRMVKIFSLDQYMMEYLLSFQEDLMYEKDQLDTEVNRLADEELTHKKLLNDNFLKIKH
jgi:hypothetical protein